MKKTNKVQTNNIFEILSSTDKVQSAGYFYYSDSQDWYQTSASPHPHAVLLAFQYLKYAISIINHYMMVNLCF